MVTYVTNKKDGLQIEEAPNSLRTIAPYIEVSLYGLTSDGLAFYEISFRRKMDNQIVKRVIPASALMNEKEIISFLVNNGFPQLPLKEDEKLLCNFLKESSSEASKCIFVDKLGWIEDKFANDYKLPYVYVTPDKHYGTIKNSVQIRYVKSDTRYSQNMEVSGTLSDWKNNVGRYVKYSPLMTLAVCMSLGTIAMKHCNIENFVVHIYSVTSKGKSNIQLVSQSLFRKVIKRKLPSWNITFVGFIDMCRAYSDSILVLDDLTQYSGKLDDLQRMVYQGANGSGKITSFSYAKGVDRVEPDWNIALLSSGEKSITQILEEGNVKLYAGREVRCFELNANRHPEYFTFTSLPKKFKKSVQLAKLIEENTSKYYGTPAREFLRKFLKNPDKRIAFIKRRMANFYEQQELEEGGVKGRITDRFAFLEAVGLLAIKFKILPIKKKLLKKHIRLLCAEILAQHKTDEELRQEGLRLFQNALRTSTLVKVKQKGKTFTDAEKMAFGYAIMRDKEPSRHFIAIRKNSFDSLFESQHQADIVARHLKQTGIMSHRQVDFVDFDTRPQFHCFNLERLRKEGLYK